jgi:asparagine synthase (glutamine-hydrolysing)
MCGITGFVGDSRATGEGSLDRTIARMTESLRHRGPDGDGVWTDAAAGVALGHRRLAVIDLSPTGAQPMHSANGRYVITYNGEVFNFAELRRDLAAAGVHCRGRSDTEVIVEGCALWGVATTVRRLVGMFAFALWDRESRTLHLVRDRMGIKPLYWAQFGSLLLFGSELKALRAHGGWTPELNRDAVTAFMRHNYIPAPHAIYRRVSKLEPGCILTRASSGATAIERYWDLRQIAAAGVAGSELADLGEAEAVEQTDRLLREAVRLRMVADVPLGVLLSGGVDSSTVAALMQAQSDRPVRSYTIGFREASYDEAKNAKAVARHLGLDHTELYVEPSHARDVIPRLSDWYDEPFADSSQIPTFLVSELARRHLTVVLSGDGGDELFAGYSRYNIAERIWRKLAWMPRPLRVIAGAAIRAVPQALWTRVLRRGFGVGSPQAGYKVHQVAAEFAHGHPDAIYRRLISHWNEPEAVVVAGHEPKGVLWDDTVRRDLPDFVDRMRFLDMMTYLPDDILTKVDRASMAVGLEARVPLLDHRVVEFSWRLPARYNSRAPRPKWLLRRILNRYVPGELIERPKMGFGVPIDSWLRGPLRDWAESLLDEGRLRREGVFEPGPIRSAWREHLSGAGDRHYMLWNALMFQAWRERWLP